jgi:hypothetical protein
MMLITASAFARLMRKGQLQRPHGPPPLLAPKVGKASMQACVPRTQHSKLHMHADARNAPLLWAGEALRHGHARHGPESKTDVQSDVQRTRVCSPLSSWSRRARAPSTTGQWPHRKGRQTGKTQLAFLASQHEPR